MCAEFFDGHVVHAKLAGGPESLSMLSRLLDASEGVTAYEIDDRGHLTAFVLPGLGEDAFVRALEASGVYPLETTFGPGPGLGGPRAC